MQIINQIALFRFFRFAKLPPAIPIHNQAKPNTVQIISVLITNQFLHSNSLMLWNALLELYMEKWAAILLYCLYLHTFEYTHE